MMTLPLRPKARTSVKPDCPGAGLRGPQKAPRTSVNMWTHFVLFLFTQPHTLSLTGVRQKCMLGGRINVTRLFLHMLSDSLNFCRNKFSYRTLHINNEHVMCPLCACMHIYVVHVCVHTVCRLCTRVEYYSAVRKAEATAICNDMDGPWGHYATWSQSVRKS